MVTFKTWTQTLKNLDPKKAEQEKATLLKTWALKNLDPKKPGPRKIWAKENVRYIRHIYVI